MNNFSLVNADTDSISFCKKDGAPFSKEEQTTLIEKLNSLFPKTISWEHDGIFPRFIVLKAKNYIYQNEEGKVSQKGSSLKASTMERKLKDFIQEIINALLTDKDNFIDIYHKYIKEAKNITDITPWAKKITISTRTIDSERANETKIIDVLQANGLVAREGDRYHVFYKPDGTLDLAQNFKGEYNMDRILEKLYKSTDRFSTILKTEDLFLNYKLKRNKKFLELL